MGKESERGTENGKGKTKKRQLLNRRMKREDTSA